MFRTIRTLAASLRRQPQPTTPYGEAGGLSSTVSARPLVGAHQRMALKHAQLASEIGWKGPQATVRGGRG